LLKYRGLLPFAVLGKTKDKQETLSQVAQQIESISPRSDKNNVTASTAILAGLVLEKQVIRRLLREEIMKESVIYQEIEAIGKLQGKQEGKQEEALALVKRLLNRKLPQINPETENKINQLSVGKLEDLIEALLDIDTEADLVNWLNLNCS
jgi:predicted transposase YdaD